MTGNLISIVDDDESVRDSTEALLRSTGYKIAKFESGEQFLQSGKVVETRCLILDIRMPGMDGLDLLRQLNVDVPVIFVTAHDTERNRQLAFEAGASDFFQKPFAATDFLTAVQTAVSQRSEPILRRRRNPERSGRQFVDKDFPMAIGTVMELDAGAVDRGTNLDELISAIPAAVYACDTAGRLIYYNRHAGDLWGRDLRLSDPAWSFLDWGRMHRADGTALRPDEAPIIQVLASGSPLINEELVLERFDSSCIDVLVNTAPLRDSVGRLVGAVSIFQDVSELKRVQNERERLLHELERSNCELSRFSYAVSHDLQAPIRSVRALTQLLIKRTDGSLEDAAHLADLIEQATAGMERMIDSLLCYAQVGQGELRRQLVSVEEVVDSVRISLGSLIAKTGASISSRTLPRVQGDPALLQQLIQNLLANAIKYHRPDNPPVIEIDGAPSEEGWRFAVKDNGQGIPQEYQAIVFEPLKRLHGANTPGSGLGLALCRTIVSRHGGRIWVESEGAGKGATFRFTLANPERKS